MATCPSPSKLRAWSTVRTPEINPESYFHVNIPQAPWLGQVRYCRLVVCWNA